MKTRGIIYENTWVLNKFVIPTHDQTYFIVYNLHHEIMFELDITINVKTKITVV